MELGEVTVWRGEFACCRAIPELEDIQGWRKDLGWRAREDDLVVGELPSLNVMQEFLESSNETGIGPGDDGSGLASRLAVWPSREHGMECVRGWIVFLEEVVRPIDDCLVAAEAAGEVKRRIGIEGREGVDCATEGVDALV